MKFLAAIFLGTLVLANSALAQPSLPKKRGFDETSIGIDQKLGANVPMETKWADQTGKNGELREFINPEKPTLLVPVFFRCTGSCLIVLDGVVQGINALKNDPAWKRFNIVAFSINPKEGPNDAKIRWTEFVKAYRFGDKSVESNSISFLTGDQDSITALTTAIGFRYTYEPEIDRINHAAGVMMLNKNGTINEYFYGTEYPGVMLLKALDRADRNEVAMAAQPVLFGCFMYDPVTGKYKPLVYNLLLAGGILTVMVLGTSIAVMSIHSRRHPLTREEALRSMDKEQN